MAERKDISQLSDVSLKGQITRARREGDLTRLFQLQGEHHRRYRASMDKKVAIEQAQRKLSSVQRLAWKWHGRISTKVAGKTRTIRT